MIAVRARSRRERAILLNHKYPRSRRARWPSRTSTPRATRAGADTAAALLQHALERAIARARALFGAEQTRCSAQAHHEPGSILRCSSRDAVPRWTSRTRTPEARRAGSAHGEVSAYRSERPGRQHRLRRDGEAGSSVRPSSGCRTQSYPRDLDYAAFKAIADEVGARTMADVSHVGGLIAAGLLANPVAAGFDVVTTTTHKTLRGPRGGLILCTAALAKTIDAAVFPGLQGGPHMNNVAGAAITFRKASEPAFRVYAEQVLAGAKAMVRVLGPGHARHRCHRHHSWCGTPRARARGRRSEEVLEPDRSRPPTSR